MAYNKIPIVTYLTLVICRKYRINKPHIDNLKAKRLLHHRPEMLPLNVCIQLHNFLHIIL